MRSRSSRHTFLSFSFSSLVRFFLEPALHKFFPCPIPRWKCRGRFGDSHRLTTDHSECQMLIRPHDSPHFGHIFVRFWRASSSRTRFVFHTVTAIQKCFMPDKSLCLRYSMLSITPFQFFISFCCVFVKFDSKFDRATLSKTLLLHFRNVSLVNTLTQLSVKSDMSKLSSWNLHWISSRNVRLGWCRRRCYSFASSRPRI